MIFQFFPVCFILMMGKSKDLYLEVFNKVREFYPNLYPMEIMCDFELGFRAAISEMFPLCVITGCWFHFSQVILQFLIIIGMDKILLIFKCITLLLKNHNTRLDWIFLPKFFQLLRLYFENPLNWGISIGLAIKVIQLFIIWNHI